MKQVSLTNYRIGCNKKIICRHCASSLSPLVSKLYFTPPYLFEEGKIVDDLSVLAGQLGSSRQDRQQVDWPRIQTFYMKQCCRQSWARDNFLASRQRKRASVGKKKIGKILRYRCLNGYSHIEYSNKSITNNFVTWKHGQVVASVLASSGLADIQHFDPERFSFRFRFNIFYRCKLLWQGVEPGSEKIIRIHNYCFKNLSELFIFLNYAICIRCI